MPPRNSRSEEIRRQAVETFWESFPRFWHQIRAHIRQVAMEQHSISVEQFHILRNIRRGKSSVSELADAKNISRPAISQAVDVLVNKGLIRRTTDLHDRRHIQLTLTESGDALLDAIFEDTRRWMMQTLSPLSDEELQTLRRAMDSLKKTQVV
jgi:MarR family transcriptional regulator, 2-MHQ and catechol-resistance regulon repressor